MLRKALLLAAASVLVLFAAGSSFAELPSLIDREAFFGNPEYAGSQISPDGKYISFIKPYHDVRNIWVKGVNEPFDKARPVTAEGKRPIANYFWSWDSRRILFVKDNDGDENFNLYVVDPASANGPDGVPVATNLTNAQKVRTEIYNVPRSDPNSIYLGMNDRDPSWHDLYKVNLTTGQRTLLRKNEDRISGWTFDNKDQLRLATRSADNGDTEFLRVDGDKFTKIYGCGPLESCEAVRFDQANRRVYLATNHGDRDLIQLVLFDPVTMKETFIEEDPIHRVDFDHAVFSDLNNALTGTVYIGEKATTYWKDRKFQSDYDLIKQRLGDREITFGSHTKDERKYIVSTFSDVDPGTVWLFDRDSKNLTTLYQSRASLPREALAQMKSIRYPSSDGLEIPAYLTLPKGVEPKNLPLVVLPHGGPWGRDVWGFSGLPQFLANRGYAVLQPNFRASTGYGKKFLDAGNGQWGEKMQDDITWGVKYLVAQGIVDPNRAGIMGGSYGGYATLAGVAFTPDLYAAAVAIVAPSNLISLLKTIPPYWDTIRQTFYLRMGNPNTPDGVAQLTRQSPLNSADKIKTPLMVVQGANDPRVNKAEADQIVIALRDRHYPVQYLLAPDEGHGFQRPINNLALYAETEKFLAKYLGGRYQEAMTPAIAQRLQELTVDVNTVTLKK